VVKSCRKTAQRPRCCSRPKQDIYLTAHDIAIFIPVLITPSHDLTIGHPHKECFSPVSSHTSACLDAAYDTPASLRDTGHLASSASSPTSTTPLTAFLRTFLWALTLIRTLASLLVFFVGDSSKSSPDSASSFLFSFYFFFYFFSSSSSTLTIFHPSSISGSKASA
jgi:hypothetical protein